MYLVCASATMKLYQKSEEKRKNESYFVVLELLIYNMLEIRENRLRFMVLPLQT